MQLLPQIQRLVLPKLVQQPNVASTHMARASATQHHDFEDEDEDEDDEEEEGDEALLLDEASIRADLESLHHLNDDELDSSRLPDHSRVRLPHNPFYASVSDDEDEQEAELQSDDNDDDGTGQTAIEGEEKQNQRSDFQIDKTAARLREALLVSQQLQRQDLCASYEESGDAEFESRLIFRALKRTPAATAEFQIVCANAAPVLLPDKQNGKETISRTESDVIQQQLLSIQQEIQQGKLELQLSLKAAMNDVSTSSSSSNESPYQTSRSPLPTAVFELVSPSQLNFSTDVVDVRIIDSFSTTNTLGPPIDAETVHDRSQSVENSRERSRLLECYESDRRERACRLKIASNESVSVEFPTVGYADAPSSIVLSSSALVSSSTKLAEKSRRLRELNRKRLLANRDQILQAGPSFTEASNIHWNAASAASAPLSVMSSVVSSTSTSTLSSMPSIPSPPPPTLNATVNVNFLSSSSQAEVALSKSVVTTPSVAIPATSSVDDLTSQLVNSRKHRQQEQVRLMQQLQLRQLHQEAEELRKRRLEQERRIREDRERELSSARSRALADERQQLEREAQSVLEAQAELQRQNNRRHELEMEEKLLQAQQDLERARHDEMMNKSRVEEEKRKEEDRQRQELARARHLELLNRRRLEEEHRVLQRHQEAEELMSNQSCMATAAAESLQNRVQDQDAIEHQPQLHAETNAPRLHHAALQIQRLFRGHLARIRLEQWLTQRTLTTESLQEYPAQSDCKHSTTLQREMAAIEIQRHLRGWRVRRRLALVLSASSDLDENLVSEQDEFHSIEPEFYTIPMIDGFDETATQLWEQALVASPSLCAHNSSSLHPINSRRSFNDHEAPQARPRREQGFLEEESKQQLVGDSPLPMMLSRAKYSYPKYLHTVESSSSQRPPSSVAKPQQHRMLTAASNDQSLASNVGLNRISHEHQAESVETVPTDRQMEVHSVKSCSSNSLPALHCSTASRPTPPSKTKSVVEAWGIGDPGCIEALRKKHAKLARMKHAKKLAEMTSIERWQRMQHKQDGGHVRVLS